MTINVDDLVQRQASILAEIDSLNREQLESLANSPLPEDGVSNEILKARKLVRGLVRTRNVGSGDLKIYGPNTNISGFVPALPGLFVIDLLPLPDGGFDSEHVMKTPVVSWRIDGGGFAMPLIPGMPVIDRWAVLTPTGFVITDDYTSLGYEVMPITLKDWIKSEIEWVGDSGNAIYDFWTASEKAFDYSGPLPRAIWFMMSGRSDWSGTPEEMLEELSRFRDKTGATGWPSRPAALVAALKELEPILAGVGLHLARTDDGHVLVSHHSELS